MRKLYRDTYVASMEDYLQLCDILNKKKKKVHIGKAGRAYIDRNIVILSCMALLGLRVNETVTLRLQDIDFNTNTLTVRAEITKTGRERKIYIHETIREILETYIKKYKRKINKQGYIFFSKRNCHLTVSAFTHIIRRAMLGSGLAETRFISSNNKTWYKITPYAFRRAFCRELRLKNPEEPLENLAKVTGHKSLDVLNNFYIKLEARPIQERLLTKTFTQT